MRCLKNNEEWRGGKVVEVTIDRIRNHLNQPEELERMYRQAPQAFEAAFIEVWTKLPPSPVLSFWIARLNYRDPVQDLVDDESHSQAQAQAKLAEQPRAMDLQETNFSSKKEFLVMGVLALLAGLFTRFIIELIDLEVLAPISVAYGVVPFLVAYFVYREKPLRTTKYILFGLLLVSAVYLNLLPRIGGDSIELAYLHAPVLLWLIVGWAFAAGSYSCCETNCFSEV